MKNKKLKKLLRIADMRAVFVIGLFVCGGSAAVFQAKASPDLEVIEGEFIVSTIDYEDGRVVHEYMIKQTDGNYIPIDVGTQQPLPQGDTKVRAKGTMQAGRLRLMDGLNAVTLLGNTAISMQETIVPLATTSYRRVVILMNLKGVPNVKPVMPKAEHERLLRLPSSVDNYWRDSSYGTATVVSTVLPEITIDVSDIRQCDVNSVHVWSDRANAALTAKGYNLSAYTHKAYMIPVPNCGWAGLASSDKRTFHANMAMGAKEDIYSNGTTSHEFGHNLGLRHAGSDECTDSIGKPSQISSNCQTEEYGDILDTMGSSSGHSLLQIPRRLLSNYHRAYLGYLPPSKVRTITASGNYWLSSINVNPSIATNPQSLRIPRPGTTESYDLEYRTPYGSNDNFDVMDDIVNGISVRLTPSDTYGLRRALPGSISGFGVLGSVLLDGKPDTPGDLIDASINNIPFNDPEKKISFKVLTRSGNDTLVAVTINGVAPPSININDTTPPIVKLAANPRNADIGKNIYLSARAVDNSAVKSVEFYNGAQLLGTDNTKPYTYTWNTTGQTAGIKNVTAKAFDSANNSRVSEPLNITLNVPGTVPAVPWFTLSSTSVKVGSIINLTVSPQDIPDMADNVGTVYFFYEGTSTLINRDFIRPFSYSWDTTGQTVGVKSLLALTDIGGGDILRSPKINVLLHDGSGDTIPPTGSLSVSPSAVESGAAVQMTVTAADNMGFISKVEYFNGATSIGYIGHGSSPFILPWYTTGETAGVKTITAKIYDFVGNVTTTAPVNVTITGGADITPPVVSLVAQPTSAAVGSAVALTATATDNVGVTKVEFRSGTTLIGTSTASPYTVNWNTTGQTAGVKAITAKAYDAAGNVTTTAPVNVTITGNTAAQGDVNRDGKVNALDLSALITRDGTNYPAADFNGDGTVGAADMAILLSRWTW